MHSKANPVFAALLFSFACAGIAATPVVEEGCTPAETQAVVRDVLNVADYACITANADLPNAAAIAVACNIEKVLEPVIARVVADFTAKRAKYAALACAQAQKK